MELCPTHSWNYDHIDSRVQDEKKLSAKSLGSFARNDFMVAMTPVAMQ